MNFFNEIIEPLFYTALNTELPDSFFPYLNCKIPFLNGGLFQPIKNYNWVETDITINRRKENEFLVISSATTQPRDLNWIKKSIKENEKVFVTDVTNNYTVLSLSLIHI